MQVVQSEGESAICNQRYAVRNVCVTEWEASISNICHVHVLYWLLYVTLIFSVYIIRQLIDISDSLCVCSVNECIP